MNATRATELRSAQGFTLIEVMVVVVIVAILASVAFPAYLDHVRRARAADAMGALAGWATRMEQYYLDNRNYGPGACGISAPTVKNYALTCALTGGGQGFTLTATGQVNSEGTYTLREGNQKATTMFKGAATSATCWLLKGSEC